MKPVICVPMGDPAGVGPEIISASIDDPAIKDKATIVVVGHKEVLERAAKAMNCSPQINVLDSRSNVREKAMPGALNLIHIEGLDLNNFSYGKVQKDCGAASFEYIKAGVELAENNQVDALATTPINKESLKAASVPYIGHTEILGGLTNSHDPLTMFQVFDLRVFFLSRHVSLRKACDLVTKERVLDYIKRCTESLKQLGIKSPKMVVAGLNPHCGEHGLFGTEEDDFITPAIEEAIKQGYNVIGPKPADSVFHFALKGTWDAVLSLYHDQGHIATKMVDFERTIALTLGLPFLRTSVDHGTAYDIAGKGIVSAVSMVEAIRLAALYAANIRENR